MVVEWETTEVLVVMVRLKCGNRNRFWNQLGKLFKCLDDDEDDAARSGRIVKRAAVEDEVVLIEVLVVITVLVEAVNA